MLQQQQERQHDLKRRANELKRDLLTKQREQRNSSNKTFPSLPYDTNDNTTFSANSSGRFDTVHYNTALLALGLALRATLHHVRFTTILQGTLLFYATQIIVFLGWSSSSSAAIFLVASVTRASALAGHPVVSCLA